MIKRHVPALKQEKQIQMLPKERLPAETELCKAARGRAACLLAWKVPVTCGRSGSGLKGLPSLETSFPVP